MKVALVHDWLTGMRGGERVLERLCGLFPQADVFTLLWNRGAVSPAIEARTITTSFIQHLPAAASRYRWYLPLFPAAIERLRLDAYDTVISTSHAVAKGVRVPGGAFHLSYVFTPMRYVWDLEADYFPPGRFPWPLNACVRRTCAWLREWDARTSQAPDALVGISDHVAERIGRHYGRSAEVVYPPVELNRFAPSADREDFYLLAGAFAPYKRGDLAIDACRRLDRRLVVVGSGQEAERLHRRAGPGVTFRGWVPESEMARLYRTARALLFPGEEDFGIVPVEAMASGCPVIAFGRGGAVETVGRGADTTALATVRGGGVVTVNGGVLFGTQSVDGLCAAIESFERGSFEAHRLRAQAQPFSADAFDRGFMAAFERGRAAAAGR